MASVVEVGAGIYRINVEIPGKPVTFSLFLVNDEQPTLIETSYRRVFDEVIDAVATVIDPSTLRHVDPRSRRAQAPLPRHPLRPRLGQLARIRRDDPDPVLL